MFLLGRHSSGGGGRRSGCHDRAWLRIGQFLMRAGMCEHCAAEHTGQHGRTLSTARHRILSCAFRSKSRQKPRALTRSLWRQYYYACFLRRSFLITSSCTSFALETRQAGFDWREPGCSMCLGMNPDRLKPQELCVLHKCSGSRGLTCAWLVNRCEERCAATSNRNFEGRQAGDHPVWLLPSGGSPWKSRNADVL